MKQMGLPEDFEAAAKDASSGIEGLPKINNEQKLILYALYKQV